MIKYATLKRRAIINKDTCEVCAVLNGKVYDIPIINGEVKIPHIPVCENDECRCYWTLSYEVDINDDKFN